MKTLCETCRYGLVRQQEVYLCSNDFGKIGDYVVQTKPLNKCLLGDDYTEIVTKCTKYQKSQEKATYSDPDFEEYVKKVENE
jgi:hypothetical protein